MAMEDRSRTKVQTLYDACNEVFSSHKEQLPTFQQIHWLKTLMATMEAVDVGIDEFSPGSPSSSLDWPKELISAQEVSKITYIHVHECDDFSMGVFCFPAGATFPLHDHPGMTVLSKLLYGSMYVKAYDWVKVEESKARTSQIEGPRATAMGNQTMHREKDTLAGILIDVVADLLCLSNVRDTKMESKKGTRHTSFRVINQKVGLAGTVMDGVMKSPCETSVLFPRSGGNIHRFTALTPCAILDVLSPPYSEEHGRPSTYFLELPIPSLPGYVVLEERDLPEDLEVVGAPYLGPPVVTVEDDLC